jgi:hypothetical protein
MLERLMTNLMLRTRFDRLDKEIDKAILEGRSLVDLIEEQQKIAAELKRRERR